MLTTCRYCGRVHDTAYDCGRRPKPKYPANYERADVKESRFRHTARWTRKSLEIRQRDHFLCQVCIRGLYQYGQQRALNYEDISVHHIQPLKDAWERRLDNDNLISLCQYHHELAENGDIPRGELEDIAREQSAYDD